MDIDDKKLKLDHVLYEIKMYQHTLSPFLNGAMHVDEITKNVWLESHMLHLRNMFFFFNNNKKNDDIIYSDIIGKQENEYSLHSEYKKYGDVINKSITHITESRCQQKIIDLNNSYLFIYCYYSQNEPSDFDGIGHVISKFLNTLYLKKKLPQNILQELKSQNIYARLNENIDYNISLNDRKEEFIIKKYDDDEIDVKLKIL